MPTSPYTGHRHTVSGLTKYEPMHAYAHGSRRALAKMAVVVVLMCGH